MKIQFMGGEGRHYVGAVNYLISEDGALYAECPVPEGAAEDYGYLALEAALLKAAPETDGLAFWYDGQEDCLSGDASADVSVYVDVS